MTRLCAKLGSLYADLTPPNIYACSVNSKQGTSVDSLITSLTQHNLPSYLWCTLPKNSYAFVDLESRTIDHGQSALRSPWLDRSIDRIVGPPSDLVSIDSVLINDIGSLSSSKPILNIRNCRPYGISFNFICWKKLVLSR